jgi:hypothetical protein
MSFGSGASALQAARARGNYGAMATRKREWMLRNRIIEQACAPGRRIDQAADYNRQPDRIKSERHVIPFSIQQLQGSAPAAMVATKNNRFYPQR